VRPLILRIALWISVLSIGVSSAASNQPPNPGSTHHSALQSEVHSLDPLLSVETNSQLIITNSYDGLVRWTAKDGIEPVIATHWTFSDDKREIRFHLRPSVRFHDGSPLTAREARLHFLRILNYKGYYSAHFENMESVAAPSASELVIRLKKPNPYFLHLLGGVAGRIVKFEKRRRVVGSGPFRPEIQDGGKRVLLMRDEKYWGPHPFVKQIDFRVADERRALQMTGKGELDDLGIFSLNLKEIAELPAGRTLRQPLWATWAIGFDQRVKPLDSLAVRRGIADKIKSADWVKRFFPDQMVAYGLLPFGMPGYVDAQQPEVPDTSVPIGGCEATKDCRVVIEIPDFFQLSPAFAAWIQDEARGIPGVEVSVNVAPFDSMMARYAKGVMGAYLVSYNAEYPDPSFLLRALHSRSKSNYLGIKDSKIDEWISQADAELDPVKRAEIFKMFNAYLTESAALIPLMHVIHTTWISACAQGLVLSPVGEGYFDYRGIKNSCR